MSKNSVAALFVRKDSHYKQIPPLAFAEWLVSLASLCASNGFITCTQSVTTIPSGKSGGAL